MIENIKMFILCSPFLWLFSGLFIYSDSYKISLISTALSAILATYLYGINRLTLILRSRKILYFLFICSFYAIFLKEYHGYNTNELRGLICLFVLGLFTPKEILVKIRKNVQWGLLSLSCVGVIYVYYYSTWLGLDRGAWDINPLPYTIVMSAVSCTSLYYCYIAKENRLKLAMFLSFILSLSSILLSETRTSLLSSIITSTIIVIYFLLKSSHVSLNKILTFMIILSIPIFTFKDSIYNRMNETKNELTRIQEGNLDSSFGLRLQMYNAAIDIIQSPTILGVGTDNYKALKESLYQKGIITKKAVGLNSFHNNFLHNLIINGIIGLAITLLWFIYPIILSLRNNNLSLGPILILTLVYFTSSLIDMPLQKIYSLIFYGMMMLLFLENETIDD